MNCYSKENVNTTVIVFDVVIVDQMKKVKMIMMILKKVIKRGQKIMKHVYPWVCGLCCKKDDILK